MNAQRKPRAGASLATHTAHLDTSMAHGMKMYGQEYDAEDDDDFGEYGDSEPASEYDDEQDVYEEDSYGEQEPRAVEPQVVDTGGNLQTLQGEIDDDDYGDELDMNPAESQQLQFYRADRPPKQPKKYGRPPQRERSSIGPIET